MMRSALHYLGFGVDTPAVDKTTIRALPSSWYTSQEMYELERRAIFSKKWQLITHSLRLGVTGDWIRYDVAGFEFVLCRDRQGIINGFHNICRHRAFPLVNEDHGRASIFACKYHGWSYGLNGTLAKAPRYQDIPDFDKNQNNLLPIHVHIDRQGFIWVNLDARNPPEVAWKDDFEDVDQQSRLAEFNFSDFQFDHSWDMDGEFNWKILADNYNECYHCLTAHPDVPSLADLEAYSVDTKGGAILHFANPDPETLPPGLKIASTFYFPNASMTVSPHFFFMQRLVPTSATSSSMRYEIYRHNKSSDSEFEEINAMFKRIMAEDKWLCVLTQKNLNRGVFVNGDMHPKAEKGPLYFQNMVRGLVQAHHRLETEEKCEIWVARQNLPRNATASTRDIQFCSALDCRGRRDMEF